MVRPVESERSVSSGQGYGELRRFRHAALGSVPVGRAAVAPVRRRAGARDGRQAGRPGAGSGHPVVGVLQRQRPGQVGKRRRGWRWRWDRSNGDGAQDHETGTGAAGRRVEAQVGTERSDGQPGAVDGHGESGRVSGWYNSAARGAFAVMVAVWPLTRMPLAWFPTLVMTTSRDVSFAPRSTVAVDSWNEAGATAPFP